MSKRYGKNPSYYLFNDLECKHTELAVDGTIFNIWANWRSEENRKEEAKARVNNASTK